MNSEQIFTKIIIHKIIKDFDVEDQISLLREMADTIEAELHLQINN